MIKPYLILSFFIVFIACKSSGDELTDVDESVLIDPIKVDTTVDVLAPFIPADYKLFHSSTGDANQDGIKDKVLVIEKLHDSTVILNTDEELGERTLILLLGQADSSFIKVIENDSAISCRDCGGVFGDPFIETVINDGLITLNHGIWGGHHWEQTTRFAYDPSTENWYLEKDYYASYILNPSDDPNAEALILDVDKTETVEDFGIVDLEDFSIYE